MVGFGLHKHVHFTKRSITEARYVCVLAVCEGYEVNGSSRCHLAFEMKGNILVACLAKTQRCRQWKIERREKES